MFIYEDQNRTSRKRSFSNLDQRMHSTRAYKQTKEHDTRLQIAPLCLISFSVPQFMNIYVKVSIQIFKREVLSRSLKAQLKNMLN